MVLCSKLTALTLAAFYALALAGCGAASPTCDVGSLQRHEAAIARASAEADGSGSACDAHETTCRQAAQVCEISAACNDADLSTRCERATAACARLQNCSTPQAAPQ